MGFWTRTGLGLALMVGGVAGLAYCIVELASIGTCASGGPYVSARECPAGTERYIIGIFPSIVAFLAGAGLFATRGGRRTDPGLPPTGEATLSNPVPFGNAAPSAGPLSPTIAAKDAFTTAFELRDQAMNQAMGGDSLERLERLAQLKKSGVLSDAEFEAQKAVILRG